MKPNKQTFIPSIPENDPTAHHRILLYAENGHGYCISIITLPYYDSTLEFAEIHHPDGTSSYFSLDGEELRAGPFGGGYSWTVPKYVQREALRLLLEAFPPQPAEKEEPVHV